MPKSGQLGLETVHIYIYIYTLKGWDTVQARIDKRQEDQFGPAPGATQALTASPKTHVKKEELGTSWEETEGKARERCIYVRQVQPLPDEWTHELNLSELREGRQGKRSSCGLIGHSTKYCPFQERGKGKGK